MAELTATDRLGWRPLAAQLAVIVLVLGTAYNAAQAPYYAPSHRRYSDYATGGATLWICFAVGAALLAAIVSRVNPRVGMLSTLLVLVLCIPTALLGMGH